MKYKEIKKNISNFCLQGYDLIYQDKADRVINNKHLLYKSYEPLQEIYSSNNIIYTNTIYGKGILLKNNEIKEFTNSFIKSVNNELIILSKSDGTYFYINDRLTSKLDSKIFIFYLNYINRSLFFYLKKSNQIVFFNILNNEEKIVFELSLLDTYLDGMAEKPLQVTEFSGIYNSTLVCTLNNGGILLLDIYKGEVVAYFEEARIRHNLFAKAEGSPIFWGLNHQTFIEIDVENAVILRQIDLEHYLHDFFNVKVLKPINVSFAIDGLIYFGADTDIVGIFDPIKAAIIDYHKFEFEEKYTMLKGGKENMQVKGNKIYCLDTNDTLHVLETTVGKGLA